MKRVLSLLVVCTMAVTTSASTERPVDIGTRAKGAERIVVAAVEDVIPRFDVNEFGDRLIMSQAWVRVSETLKGPHTDILPVDVEGGTIGDLTLTVSDMPVLRQGDRAVFFLDSAKTGTKPHDRGQGVLKLDASGRVQGSNMTLNEVRTMVRAAGR